MKKLVLGLLVLVLVGLVVADNAARRAAGSALTEVVEGRVPGASATEASLHGFPFLPRLFLTGQVGRVEVRQSDVPAAGLTFDEITVELEGVDLDRDALLDRRAALEGLDGGRVRAFLSEATVSSLVSLPVELTEERATATLAGRRLELTLQVDGGALLLVVEAGPALRLPLPELPLLPCLSHVRTVAGGAELTCTLDRVPDALLGRASTDF